MSAQQEAAIDAVNEVRLVGRVSQQPEERVLPSGDSVWTFRVVVPRRTRCESVAAAGRRARVRRVVRAGRRSVADVGARTTWSR